MMERLDLDFGHDEIDHGTSDDYYTPPFIFDALRLRFDLDVCSPPNGSPWIPASRFLSVIDDGLATPWIGINEMNTYPQELSTGKRNLWTTRRDHARLIHLLASNLTKAVRSILAGEPLKRIARRRSLVLLGVLCIVGTTPAQATTSTDALKLYAHSRIINYHQFQCFNQLITAESHWHIDSRNGTHYGLGQMHNERYRNLDGYRQIDWSIRYNIHRYGSQCNAYRHWQSKGWS